MDEQTPNQAPQQTPDTAVPGAQTVRKKKKSPGKTVLKVVLWLAVLALAAFVVLFVSAKIAQFESIGAMLEYIRSQFV